MTFLNLKYIRKTLKALRGKHRLLQSNMNPISIRHFISMWEEKGMLFTRFRDAIILNLEVYIWSNYQIQRQNKDIFGNLRTKKTDFLSIFISYFYCEKLSGKSKMDFNELKLRCWQSYIYVLEALRKNP